MKQKPKRLHYNTVSPLLINTLNKLMGEPLFNPFVLVGGTNLSLRLGHRRSDDIDLFTDVQYGSLNYNELEKYLKNSFPYYNCPDRSNIVGFGRSYYIGLSEENCVKLDLMYADAPFFEPFETNDGIRMATVEQIAAMKMEAINTGGRKKDWWDIHELLKKFSLTQLLLLHERWEQWTHNDENLLIKLTHFEEADKQPDPKCLKGKNWDDIKLDIIDHVKEAKEIIIIKNNITNILAKHYSPNKITIHDGCPIITNNKQSGFILHFSVDTKKRTCVTDNQTGDISICDGFYNPGEFHKPNWKTLEGKQATYTPTRVISIDNKKKFRIS